MDTDCKARAPHFSPAEQRILMDTYKEMKHLITTKGNTAAVILQRKKGWQTIADRLNAANECGGPKRTWQQVKVKYKNIRQTAVNKKAHATGTGVGPPTPTFTPAEELDQKWGSPVVEEIQGGTATDTLPLSETDGYIQVSGNTITLLVPPDNDPGEGSSTVEARSAIDDKVLLDCRGLKDQGEQPESQTGKIKSQTVRRLHTTHLRRQIELADLQICNERKRQEQLELDRKIKLKRLRILDLELEKLESQRVPEITVLLQDSD